MDKFNSKAIEVRFLAFPETPKRIIGLRQLTTLNNTLTLELESNTEIKASPGPSNSTSRSKGPSSIHRDEAHV